MRGLGVHFAVFALLSAAVLSMAGPARAALITAEADAYVQSGTNKTTNFNANNYLDVKYDSAGATSNYHRKAWVRFDLSGFTDPSVMSATLSLTLMPYIGVVTTANKVWTFNVFGLNDSDSGNTWGEAALTWNNAPGNDTTAGNSVLAASMYGGALLGSFTITGGGTVGSTVQLTGGAGSPIAQFLAADTDHKVTFVIIRKTVGGSSTDTVVHRFAASENTTYAGPQLEMTPEPATMALLGLGLGGMWLRRRR